MISAASSLFVNNLAQARLEALMSRSISHKLYSAIVTFLLILASAAVAQEQQQQREHIGATGTIPGGTNLSVRIVENLSSATSQPGDVFHGTLADDVEVNGKIIFPHGADVTGRVTDAKSSGRLSAPGILELALTDIRATNVNAKIATEPLKMEGTSHGKANTAKIGGGAAIGAVIGAIAGGGKGAAIGTVVGGAAGAGTAAATGKREATVETEALLTFTTSIDALAVKNGSGKTPTGEVRAYEDDVHVQPATPAAAAKAEQSAKPAVASTGTTQASASTTAAPAVAATAPSAPAGVSVSGADVMPEFSARDRRVLRTCLTGDTGELPTGLDKKEDVSAADAKKIHKNGTLPPTLQLRAQALPLACESQLPRLPGNMERVILNRQIILLDEQARILDIYSLDVQ
jgi:hypothetical protein